MRGLMNVVVLFGKTEVKMLCGIDQIDSRLLARFNGLG
ncbi:hypothetical protein F975_02434 [Acinetobacter sp. ANC 3789]|nr:hypothetical protein F975_02434 [Acinetobacter sp. ANC 3789]